MSFKELKKKILVARDIMIKNHDYYNNTIMHVNKENYIFRGKLNHMCVLDFELIKPNKDYFVIHPNIAKQDVKITFRYNSVNYMMYATPSPEEVSTLERFCEILGWDDNNLKEFETYLDMYNVKRI